jgi:cytoskeleton protein RodZ
MSSIGETLRRERERRNLGLEQISRELKISARFLEAIEGEHFEKLPGGVFARSFVRQYARMLGLDEDEMAAEVQRAMEPQSGVPEFIQQSKSPEPDIRLPRVEAWQNVGDKSWSSSLPALALMVVVMLVCSGVYAWWQRHPSVIPREEPRAAVQTPAQAPAVQAPATEPAAAPPVSSTQPALQSSAQSAPVQPVQPPPSPRAAETTKPPVEASVRPPVNAANAPVRVDVTADETVWVLAQGDGKYLFSGTLEANQTRTVQANDKVLLRLGNAGGVTITLNGKPIGAVGPKGQVRTVQFTSGGFQIVAAPKPSLPLDESL